MNAPAPNAPLPFIDLGAQRRRLGKRIDAAMLKVVDQGKYILGPEVAEVERQLATVAGVTHALGCSNGTDALGLALRAMGVKAGDAVFVPTFTFAASAEVVAWLGATPVFIDVAPDTFNLDPASLEAGIVTAKRHGLKPVAVMPVDLYGQPADYDAIRPIAQAEGLWILADAAQSFGASLGDRKVGQMAEITTTSFFPSKPLGCYGDGGAVFTDDPKIAALIDSLRVHGKGTDKYDNVRIGANCRLDTLQAAVLLAKLEIFADELEARDRIAARYSELLSDVTEVPRLIAGARSVWAQYTIKVGHRDAVAAALKAQGIPTMVYYPMPLHRQTAYKHYPVAANGLPVAERLSQTVLSLPMHPYLDTETQDRIVAALKSALP